MTLIALTTAGSVDEDLVAFVETCIALSLGVTTKRLPPMPHPDYAWDAVRQQYNSPLIMREALRLRPPDAAKLLVLTECDLFIPMLSFVYGQAQLDGAVAVLSLARLRQEYYGLPQNRPLFLMRIRKELLHELGHTAGLTHCDDRIYTMALSTNIQQLDAKGNDFCEGCSVLLREHIADAGLRATPGETT